MDWLKTVRRTYEKIKKMLLYLVVLVILVILYVGEIFGMSLELLLPIALVGAFTILMESIFSIDDKIEGQLDFIFYPDLATMMPKIISLVQQRGRRKHTIKAVGSSGGTTINAIVPRMIENASSPIEVNLKIINPESPNKEYFPRHWLLEAKATAYRAELIERETDHTVSVECKMYDHMPCIKGMLINEQHLFLSVFTWMQSGKKYELSAEYHPHFYYQRTAQSEELFRIFETWFDYAPATQIDSTSDS